MLTQAKGALDSGLLCRRGIAFLLASLLLFSAAVLPSSVPSEGLVEWFSSFLPIFGSADADEALPTKSIQRTLPSEVVKSFSSFLTKRMGDTTCGACTCRQCVPIPELQNPDLGYAEYCANPEFACPSHSCVCDPDLEPDTTPVPIPSPGATCDGHGCCVNCWPGTAGICKGPDTVCWDYIGGACPGGTIECADMVLDPDPSKWEDDAEVERVTFEYYLAANDKEELAIANSNMLSLPEGVDEVIDQGGFLLKTFRGHYMANHPCYEGGVAYDAAACAALPTCSSYCEAELDPEGTGQACGGNNNGRSCEDTCGCGICASYGGCSTGISCKPNPQVGQQPCSLEEPPPCESCTEIFGTGPYDCGGHPCEDACNCGVCGSYGFCTPELACKVRPAFGRYQCTPPPVPALPEPLPPCADCTAAFEDSWKLMPYESETGGEVYEKSSMCGDGQPCRDDCDCGVCGSYGGCSTSCAPFPHKRFACDNRQPDPPPSPPRQPPPACLDCTALYDPFETGTACDGRSCEDTCGCGVCGSYGGCSTSCAPWPGRRYACTTAPPAPPRPPPTPEAPPPPCEACEELYDPDLTSTACGGKSCADVCGCGVCGSNGMCQTSCVAKPAFGRYSCTPPPPSPPPPCSECVATFDPLGTGVACGGRSCEDFCRCGVCGSFGGCGVSCSPSPGVGWHKCSPPPPSAPLPPAPPPPTCADCVELYDPGLTGTACDGRSCEDTCGCGVCGSHGGGTTSCSPWPKRRYGCSQPLMTCRSTGDPHMGSFSGHKCDFHGIGARWACSPANSRAVCPKRHLSL